MGNYQAFKQKENLSHDKINEVSTVQNSPSVSTVQDSPNVSTFPNSPKEVQEDLDLDILKKLNNVQRSLAVQNIGNKEKVSENRIDYSCGSYYEGDIKYDKKHGYGVLVSNNKDVYTGQFIYDEREGEGTFQNYENKSINKGQYKNDELNGFGQMIQGRNHYIGYWKEAMMNGIGLFYLNKTLISGIWKDNELVSKLDPTTIKFPSQLKHLVIDLHKLPFTVNFTDDNQIKQIL